MSSGILMWRKGSPCYRPWVSKSDKEEKIIERHDNVEEIPFDKYCGNLGSRKRDEFERESRNSRTHMAIKKYTQYTMDKFSISK